MGWKRSLADTVLSGASTLGIWKTINRLSRKRITVLAYHRVVDISRAGFDTYQPNVSASPDDFQAQMDYVKEHYDVIDIEHLTLWLQGERDLPARPLVITFDDGYRDNYEHAYPILCQRKLPALLFVTTNFIGGSHSFYWDRMSRGFHHTQEASISIPGLGDIHWTNPKQRALALRQIIGKLKLLPNEEKEHLVDLALEALGMDTYRNAEPLAMDWDQVREMEDNGFSIGGHTHTHPILTRISLDQGRDEIRTCLAIIKKEIKRPALAFAYTNGLESDFNIQHEKILDEIGVQAAFSLLPGPTSRAEVQARPLAIRRILISHRDRLSRFEAKLAGAARLTRDWL